jgi:AcrR family transcriptional regulator
MPSTKKPAGQRKKSLADRARPLSQTKLGLSVQDRLARAAQELAHELPIDRIDVAKVARRAQVSWPTASRYLRDKQHLRAQLSHADPELARGSSSRALLLDAAQRVFARYGYASATLDEIGRQAGASKATVYQHFASKTELFLALLEARDEALASSAPAEIAQVFSKLPPSQAFARVLQLEIARMSANKDYTRLYVEFLAASRERPVRDRLRASHKRQLGILVGLVQGLVQAGVLVVGTPAERVARILLLLLDGLTLQSLVIEGQGQQVANEIAEVLWLGLAPWVQSPASEHQ